MKDLLYLKRYVQMHPDNKMGWYLLGKEYEREGQPGKANYCFNRSGGVYEAFETSKKPSDLWNDYEFKLIQQAQKRERRSIWIRRTLTVMMLFLLTLVPTVNAPQREGKAETALSGKTPDVGIAKEQPSNGKSSDRGQLLPPDKDKAIFTAAQAGGYGAGDNGIKPSPFARPGRLHGRLAVLEMKKNGDWLIWKRRMPLGYTLESSGPGSITYQSYNPQDCSCQPPEAGNLKDAAFAWTGEQEEQAMLYSAIKAYKNRTGQFPDELSDLLRPFPENWVSGTTQDMKEVFQPLLQKAKAEASGKEPSASKNAADAKAGDGTFLGTWGSKPFFAEPLKIIVDKNNHRLAVVSGRVMLRNYKVGLGGERTPEGSFVITDKVMNPNGRSDGEFGSRGMQLSETNYAIHGTNDPDSFGKDESLGCIRMSQTDIEELFDLVPMGTPVIISKGGAPDELLAPQERFRTKREQDQTNPRKTYHWL
ncbi:L,D-transpeptidase [Paenibacillus donghaensis]|uniref:L,D-transpeptidase n=1 Tax=Paenibacillus donghaensis TaxID=414771 RepID=UPI001883ED65|nr:L,D-transpeptidase [Paenibacillus donghaensis]MBE9914331.1 L,D-transpeptidase [Paenibacillus donghaensis]